MTLDLTIGQKGHHYSQQGSDIPAVTFNQMMDQQIPSSSLVDVQVVVAQVDVKKIVDAKGVLILLKSSISRSINGFQGQFFLSDSASVQFIQSTKGLNQVDQHVCLFLQP